MYGKLQKDSLRPNSTKIVIDCCSILFTMQQGVPPADQASPTCGRTAIAAGRWGLVSRGDSENHWDLIYKWFMGYLMVYTLGTYADIYIYIGMNIEWYNIYIYIHTYTYFLYGIYNEICNGSIEWNSIYIYIYIYLFLLPCASCRDPATKWDAWAPGLYEPLFCKL